MVILAHEDRKIVQFLLDHVTFVKDILLQHLDFSHKKYSDLLDQLYNLSEFLLQVYSEPALKGFVRKSNSNVITF